MKPFFKYGLIFIVGSSLLSLPGSCKKKMTITTSDVSGITQVRAESGGNVISGNNIHIVSKGVCWASEPDPTPADNKTEEGPGNGTFASVLSNLEPGTEYYVRAYAIIENDTVFGRNISFSTTVYPTVEDIDGNVYNVVTIGKQAWMGENLRTSKYNDGKSIPVVTDESSWAALTTPACCWYKNDEEAFKETYGALYNWYSVNTGRLCPEGWHVPSDEDWNELMAYAGGESIAGGKLKEPGTTYWVEPNHGASNDFGFTALPGGFRYSDGKYFDFGFSCYWWSSTGYSESRAFFRFIYYSETTFYRFDNSKKNGFSVRCLKD